MMHILSLIAFLGTYLVMDSFAWATCAAAIVLSCILFVKTRNSSILRASMILIMCITAQYLMTIIAPEFMEAQLPVNADWAQKITYPLKLLITSDKLVATMSVLTIISLLVIYVLPTWAASKIKKMSKSNHAKDEV